MKTVSQEFVTELNAFLSEEFEVESAIMPDMTIMEALELDSLDLIDLVVAIEQKYGVKVQGEDFAIIKTMDDFYSHIYTRIAA